MKRNAGLVLAAGLAQLALAGTTAFALLVDQVPAFPSALVIDARQSPPGPEMLSLSAGGQSPGGHTLSGNNRYLMRDGKPWFAIMGEFHYARYPEASWEEEILRLKANGVERVSVSSWSAARALSGRAA